MNLMRLRNTKQTLLVMNAQAWDALRDDVFALANIRISGCGHSSSFVLSAVCSPLWGRRPLSLR